MVQEYLVSGSQTVDFTISGLRSRCRLDAKKGREGTRERERERERARRVSGFHHFVNAYVPVCVCLCLYIA